MGKIIKRKLYINKKSLYRRLAEERKTRWADKHHLQHDDQFKFHFHHPQDPVTPPDHPASSRPEHRADQKVKNRLAAQESREKRKNYVEELERRLETYEEMLETQTCRHCHGSLRERSDTELELSEEKMTLKEKEIKVEDYFEEGMIRVDNHGASTPFAVFFFLCFIVVLTVFTYRSTSSAAVDPRLLSNYDSLLQAIHNEPEDHLIPRIKKPLSDLKPRSALAASLDEPPIKETENGKAWRRLGDLLCSKLVEKANERKSSPFLMLRTADDKPSQGEQEAGSEVWQRGDLLTCIIAQTQ